MTNRKGSFIAFEGIDGSGKSTQVRKLGKLLLEKNIKCYITKEPTDSPIGSLIQQIMTGRMSADSRVIASLFAADRLEHLLNGTDGICRQIDSGITVVTDRYYFSSYAYQSVELDMDWLIQTNSLSAGLLRPTVTLFLDVPVKTALERIRAARRHTELYEKEERLRTVREQYFKAFERLKHEETVVIVDADGDTDDVFQKIWSAISHLLT